MAEIKLGTWSPARLHVALGGVRITGFGDDDMVSLAYDGDKFTKTTGVVDEVARSHVNINGATFTFSLLQTSIANDIFNRLLANDLENQKSGAGNASIFTLTLMDKNGTTNLLSAQSWIRNYADLDFGKEVKMRSWVVDAAHVVGHTGGNASTTAPFSITGSIALNLNN